MKIKILSDRKIEVPVELTGAEIKKTTLGYKVKCKRCGVWFGFSENDIETARPPGKISEFSSVAAGYVMAQENNQLVEDIEAKKVDWVEYLRRCRRLTYNRVEPSLSASIMMSLLCPDCNSKTSIYVKIGGTVELKKLPKSAEVLTSLGITKPESIQFFQLRTGKIARKFVDAMKSMSDDIAEIEKIQKNVEKFCAKIDTPSDFVSDVVTDITRAATTSGNQKIQELEEYQKSAIDEMERLMFPQIRGSDEKPTKKSTAEIAKELGGKIIKR